MKLNLSTRLYPTYNPMVSLAERRAKAEEEAKKAEEEKKVQELYDSIESINTFALGTTPNFTIDLNKDLLKLEDIEQLTVTFGQFGKVVQREILYFSDNYKLDYDLVDEEYDGEYEDDFKPLSADVVVDDREIFNDDIRLMPTGFYEDSEGHMLKKEPCKYRDPASGILKKASRFYREVEEKYIDSEGEAHIRLIKLISKDAEGHIWYEDKNGYFVVKDGEKVYDTKRYPDLTERKRWRHHRQAIRNPKFSYNRVYNVLTLTLSQIDTLNHFKPTDWYWYNESEGETKPSMPYWKNNPSLVMIEVKIKVRNAMEQHIRKEVIIRPQEYWAVADTIEHSLERTPRGGVNTYDHSRGADPIFVPHRFRYFFGDYWVNPSVRDLPDRVEDLAHSGQIAKEILCRDGLRVRSFPRFKTFENSEGEVEYELDELGHKIELNRYFCIMIPLHIKVKIKNIKLLYGGSPGVMDHIDYDTTGLIWDSEAYVWRDSESMIPVHPRVTPSYKRYADHEFKNENNQFFDGSIVFDADGNPVYQNDDRNETVYYNSSYVIDPDGTSPENPMGEYICWYICSKETVTGMESRFFGPRKYREDQRKEPYYEFLIQFEELDKAK